MSDNDEQKIYIDFKLNNTLRKYKENDNILYTVGIDNYILGFIRISAKSEENESQNYNIEEKYLKKIKNILPIGLYINGVIAIYNENTFEDFETVLNEQLEKIKEINSDLFIAKSKDDIKYIQLALKELLYLDDEEEFSFEYKKYGDLDDFEIDINSDLIQKYFKGEDAKYKFLINRIQILFNNSKNEENVTEITKEKLNDLNELFDMNKEILLKIDQNLVTDFNNVFNEIKVDEYNKTNPNIINLFYSNIQLGFKEKIIENIKITDLEIKDDLNSNFNIETIGIISSTNSQNTELFKSMLLQTKENIQKLFSKENNITQNNILYNNLYNSTPFSLTTFTPINITNNTISINSKQNSEIEDQIKLSKTYHIIATSFFNFCPLINSPSEKKIYEHLLNPHLSISNINKQPENSHIIRALVKGNYHYYHYNQDNFNDAGWGCAYRSLQTLFSWFILNTSIGYGKKVPTIPEIQTILVKLGDKDKNIINSNNWIGAIEVNLVLNELLGIENQILYVPSGADLNSKGRELLYHFQTNGTPVMVGGGVYAYTILGVDYDKVKGECKFLILDPHYTGEDDVKSIVNRGWCNWKNIDLFKKENFYNLCLPLAS